MAHEHVGVIWTAGATLAVRCIDPEANQVFDWSDNTWKTAGSVVTAEKVLAECTVCGDSENSLYSLEVDLEPLDYHAEPRPLWVQLVADDEVIDMKQIWVAMGARYRADGATHIR